MSLPRTGDSRDPWRFGPLTVEDFVRYQGASGDFNPVHYDVSAARAAGYPGPFSVGMLAAGLLATYASDWFGPENLRRFAVRFAEQAWPGDELTFTARVSAVRDQGSATFVDLELACTRQSGGVHVHGAATYLLQA